MKASSKRIISILIALSMVVGLLAIMPVFSSASNVDFVLREHDSLAAIQADLNYYFGRARAGDTITVTGQKTGAEGTLDLNIPAGVTVVWAAEYEGEAASRTDVSWETRGNVYRRPASGTANNVVVNFMSPATGTAFLFAQRTGSAAAPDARAIRAYGLNLGAATAGTYFGGTGTRTVINRAMDFFVTVETSPGNFSSVIKLAPYVEGISIARNSQTQANISFRNFVPGVAYYLALEAGSAAPSRETIRGLGASLGDVAAAAAGTVFDANITLPEANMDIYVVVQDSATLAISYPMRFSTSNSALINNTGAGMLVIADGADIKANAEHNIAINSISGNVTVNGGSIEAAANAVRMIDNTGGGATGNINITGGTINADGIAINVSDAFRDTTHFGFPVDRTGTTAVRVSGGTITGGPAAVQAQNTAIFVSGNAALKATDAESIGVNITGNGRLNITGGSIEGSTALVQANDVSIQGGTLTGTTHGIDTTGNVTVSAGKVEATGENGYAIETKGNVTVSGGAVEAKEGTAIMAEGNIAVSGGSVTGANYAIYAAGTDDLFWDGSIKAALGHVTVSGGTITAIGDDGIAIETDTGSITVSGGAITATGEDGTAIKTYSGNILVTGGTIAGDTAISIESYGAAAILAGTTTGEFAAENDSGLIVEVAYPVGANIDAALNQTTTGLTILAGAELLDDDETPTAVWDCAGTRPAVALILGDGRVVRFDWGRLVGIILSNGTAVRSSDTAATISFNTSIAGTAYYFAVDAGSAAPSREAIAAGTELGAVAVGQARDLAVALTAGAKDIYVVVVDAAGHISTPLRILAPAFMQQFNVVVTGGSGSGSYVQGTPVFLAADVPQGKRFVKWTVTVGGVEITPNTARTSFIMPANNVTVTAEFEEITTVRNYILSTKYESNVINWILFIVLFGWIWMWFIPPT